MVFVNDKEINQNRKNFLSMADMDPMQWCDEYKNRIRDNLVKEASIHKVRLLSNCQVAEETYDILFCLF